VRDVRLIDVAAQVSVGKALDIRQSGPVDGYDTRVSGSGDVLAATGADVIVIADAHVEGEWEGDRGLALVRQLLAAGTTAPIVFAGPKQTWLMEASVRELGLDADRVVGTAAGALTGAMRSLAALEADGSGADVSLVVSGRPPAFLVAWSSATIGGTLVTDRVPAHRLMALSQQLPALWPTRPYAIAAATTPAVEGLPFGTRPLAPGRHRVHQRRDLRPRAAPPPAVGGRLVGSRTPVPGVIVVDQEWDVRHRAALLPLTLGNGRVLQKHMPSFSGQERVEFLNSLSRS